MNIGITLARKGDKWSVLGLPHEASLRDMSKGFYELCRKVEQDKSFDEVQLWSQAGGRLKRRVFNYTEKSHVLTAEQLLAADKAAKEGGVEADVAADAATPVDEVTKPAKGKSKAKTASQGTDLLS